VKIKIKAYAKLNFFLDILGKRDDGYHELLTTMCLIDLADDVEITVSGGGGISGVDSGNTAYKAAELFLEKLGAKKHIHIEITKKIPVMAGLGGSSADAAAVLRGLNKLLGEPYTPAELMELGGKIGSDVPFLIHGGHALCKGRGTEIAEVLPLPDCVFVIIKPDFSCCTKTAYENYGKNPIPRTELKPFYNIFEKLYNNPEIEQIKQELSGFGAKSAGMTGSGSAVFGVFADTEAAQRACSWLKYTGKFIALPVDKHIYL
jgi:4-diphosphocytidyl-2-C-methyl-D-erythritol kinase